MDNMKKECFCDLNQDEVYEVNGGMPVIIAVAAKVAAEVTVKKAVKSLVKWGVGVAVSGFTAGSVYEWIMGE